MQRQDGVQGSPMDKFPIYASLAVELGQQSENAISYLDRRTEANQQDRQGTTWPKDQAKSGAICHILVRDTGFNTGKVLWRSVGLLFEGIGATGGSC